MKITLSAAMRARDVSRPRSEQLAEAAAREETRALAPPAPVAGPATGENARTPQRGVVPAAPSAPGEAPPRGRRRRRPRAR